MYPFYKYLCYNYLSYKKLLISTLLAFLVLSLSACTDESAFAFESDIKTFPESGLTDVNVDTHLVLTFSSPPTLGQAGKIEIIDLETNRLVDALDLSIPSGPNISLTITRAARKARKEAGLPEPDYQVTTIGGQEGFHFHPVIIRENVATIYPHNNSLEYGRSYGVRIGSGVFTVNDQDVSDFVNEKTWTFTTKANPLAQGSTKLTVAADGSGDFNTVQGAIEFVPNNPSERVTINVRNGNYEEIVYFRGKSNFTIRGEDREKVVVGYGNNSAFNRIRPAFSIMESTDIRISNFTINNYYIGQAEALKISGSKNVVDNMTLNGSGDALNLRGSTYLVDMKLTGDGDTILAVGPAFFERCEIHSIGPVNWIRNTDKNRGNIFKDCTFIGLDEPLPWTVKDGSAGTKVQAVLARLPDNGGRNYPYAEAVLINAKLEGYAPEGWGPVEDPETFDWTNVHFWEYNSMDLDGKPLDLSKRHPVVRELKMPEDAVLIENYSNPTWVLDGWTPELR